MFSSKALRVRKAWVVPSLAAALVVAVAAGAAAAAIETDTVSSYWRGLWWSISLMTTVGFLGEPPRTTAGAVLSVALMLVGFFLLAMVSAALAALFVREEEAPRDAREEAADVHLLEAMRALELRLGRIEELLPLESRPES